MSKVYEYRSSLADLITGFIKEKRALGFQYDMEAYVLKIFDDYWFEKGNPELPITRESLKDWMTQREGESINYLAKRVSCARLLCEYMNGIGYLCYVPMERYRGEISSVRILCAKEVSALIKAADNYAEKQVRPVFKKRMALEYAAIFRLLACCGLRNGEACALMTEDVDLSVGTLKIRHAKRNKERTVYMPDDLRIFLTSYYEGLCQMLRYQPLWFFPAWDTSSHVLKTGIDRQFHYRWAETPYASQGKMPTPHSLRHSFVVMVMNKWMEQDIDLEVMVPYLSRQLGHSSPNETFYYYHQVADAFRTIRKKDLHSGRILSEVRNGE